MPTQNLSKHRISIKNHVYHLVATTNNRKPIFANFNSARILITQMKTLNDKQLVSSLAWVVMPDHLHWLIQLKTDVELATIMKQLKGVSSIRINQQLQQKGKIWQQGYYEHQIRHDESLKRTARYIVANPLRSNLVKTVKDYPHWDAMWLD